MYIRSINKYRQSPNASPTKTPSICFTLLNDENTSNKISAYGNITFEYSNSTKNDPFTSHQLQKEEFINKSAQLKRSTYNEDVYDSISIKSISLKKQTIKTDEFFEEFTKNYTVRDNNSESQSVYQPSPGKKYTQNSLQPFLQYESKIQRQKTYLFHSTDQLEFQKIQSFQCMKKLSSTQDIHKKISSNQQLNKINAQTQNSPPNNSMFVKGNKQVSNNNNNNNGKRFALKSIQNIMPNVQIKKDKQNMHKGKKVSRQTQTKDKMLKNLSLINNSNLYRATPIHSRPTTMRGSKSIFFRTFNLSCSRGWKIGVSNSLNSKLQDKKFIKGQNIFEKNKSLLTKKDSYIVQKKEDTLMNLRNMKSNFNQKNMDKQNKIPTSNIFTNEQKLKTKFNKIEKKFNIKKARGTSNFQQSIYTGEHNFEHTFFVQGH